MYELGGKKKLIIILILLSIVNPLTPTEQTYSPSEASVYGNSFATLPREIDDSNIVKASWSTQQKSYLNHSPIRITSDADFAAQKVVEGWVGNGTPANPYVIEGYSITHNGINIEVLNVSSYFIVRDCLLMSPGTPPPLGGYDDGIAVANTSNGIITSNVFRDTTSAGVFVGWSNCTVVNNEFYNNSAGIVFYNTSGSAHHNEIVDSWDDNIILLNSEGCNISYNTVVGRGYIGVWHSRRCRIEYNTVSQMGPIQLYNSTECSVRYNEIADVGGDAIALYEVRQSVVSHNAIYDAHYDGIWVQHAVQCNFTANRIERCNTGFVIEDCSSSIFSYNYLANNRDTGITVESGNDNLLFCNLFASTPTLAIDDGYGNQWYHDAEYGNYWASSNGEEPFRIDGSAGSRDMCPLTVSDSGLSYPLVAGRCSLGYDVRLREVRITWVAWSSPGSYTLLINGIELENETWAGFGVHQVDLNLPIGQVYNYTFSLVDENGNAASHSLLVPPPPVISSPSDIVLVEGDSDVQILWEVWSTWSASYLLMHNGHSVQTGAFSRATSVLFQLDSLSPGRHNLTLVVYDENGQMSVDEVVVEVLLAPTTVQLIMYSAVGSLIAVVIVIELRSGIRKESEVESIMGPHESSE
jgi:parallel beta-helix repeat protein